MLCFLVLLLEVDTVLLAKCDWSREEPDNRQVLLDELDDGLPYELDPGEKDEDD